MVHFLQFNYLNVFYDEVALISKAFLLLLRLEIVEILLLSTSLLVLLIIYACFNHTLYL